MSLPGRSEARQRRAARRSAGLGLLLLFVVAGCASPERQINEAAELAEAGVAFSETLPPLYDAFFRQMVEADSLELKATRTALSGDIEKLEQRLDDSDQDFRQTIAVLRDLKRHAALLKSYFIALQDLASDETGKEIPPAARQAVEDLKKVGLEVSEKKVLGTNLGSLVEPIAAYSVNAAKASALREELEARGTAINVEIARHEQALGVIATRMIGDKERILIETVENPLRDEFLKTSSALPSNWWKRRADYLELIVEIESVTRAQAAVRNLRIAWENLASGRVQSTSIEIILEDIGAVKDLLAGLEEET